MDKKSKKNKKVESEKIVGEQEARAMIDEPKKTSKLTVFLLTLIPLIAAASGVAYYIYIYLPNTPENILRSAMNDLLQNPHNYTVNGEFDNESEDDLDYKFTVDGDSKGSQQLDITLSAPVSSPMVSLRRIEGQNFISFTKFLDSDELKTEASDYDGKLDLDNKLVDFARRTSVEENQDKWMLLPGFIFQQPLTANSKIANELDELKDDSIKLNTIGEEVDDKREYSLNVEANNIYRFTKLMDGKKRGLVTEALLLYEQNNRDFPDEVTLSVLVNTKTKKIEKLSMNSSQFDSASLSLSIVPQEQDVALVNPNAPLIESVLGYDFVDDSLFSEVLQVGANQADRQKVADLKAMAMALSVHKNHTGFYPDRSEIAVGGLDFITKTFLGVDRTFFVDANGKTVGLNGSLYAYVSERADDEVQCGGIQDCVARSDNCGQFTSNGTRCKKFFVATTLSDGAEFKIVGE